MADAKTQISYNEIREQILDGDVLLFRSRSFFGELLCRILRKTYTHVGVAARWNKRLMLIEAIQKHGVVARPLSTVVEKYDGKIDLWKVEKLREEIREVVVDEACSTIGMKYGKWTAIKLGWALLWKEKRVDVEEVKDVLICSESVSRWFRRSGIDLCPLLADKDTHPDDVAASEKLRKIGALKL